MDTIAFEQVYYIAETISAFVVIISLFYLGYQLRQNTQTMRVTATQAHIKAYQNTIGNFIHVPGLVNI